MAKETHNSKYKKLVVPEEVSKLSQLQFTPKQEVFLRAFIDCGYHLTNALDKSGIARATYYNWKEEYPHFNRALDLCRERFVDNIEEAFSNLIKDKNPQAVLFGLKTLGRNRGYAETMKVENDVTIKGIDIQVIPSRPKLEDKKT